MKQLNTVAHNVLIQPVEKADGTIELVPSAEVILVVTEPSYTTDLDGIVRRRAAETYRFVVGADSLRDLARNLIEAADHAEKVLLDAAAALAKEDA